jgi:hypothetical protein
MLSAIFVVNLVLHFYFVFRFGGRWVDVDSSFFKLSSESVQATGSILPGRLNYPGGFATQVISVFISDVTGVDMFWTYTVILPLVGSLVVLPVYTLMKRLLSDTPTALLSTFLIAVQPDYVFDTSRSAHMKFTLVLMILAISLLATFLDKRTDSKPSRVVAFYMVSFGLVCSNIFYASFFLAAIAISALAGGILLRLGRPSLPTRAIPPKVITATVLFLVVIFYVYTPAATFVLGLNSVFSQVAVFLTGAEVWGNSSFAGYRYVGQTWMPLYVYFAVSALTWLVLPFSGYCLIRNLRDAPESGIGSPTARRAIRYPFLTLLYLGFGVLLASTIPVDFLGLYSGNIGLRVFVPFLLFAAPMAALVIRPVFAKKRWIKSLVVAITISVFLFGAVVKPTNDPAYSNTWTFYSDGEKEAVSWTLQHVPADVRIYGDYDARLNALKLLISSPRDYDRIVFVPFPQGKSLTLTSTVLNARATRLGYTLVDSNTPEISMIYNEGSAWIWSGPS